MQQPFVIGIAGGTSSGKSTFAEQLQAALPALRVQLLHQDNYYLPHKKLPQVQVPFSGKTYRDYNHPQCIELDKLTRDLAKAKASGKYDVIIVEGLFTLQQQPIFKHLDLRLFVDCPADERIVRRLRRNMTWGLSFDEIAEFYLDLVRHRHDEFVEPTKHRADIIINGMQPFDTAVRIVANYVSRSD
ncbi:MAG: hypothetical protein FWD06_01140 [Oscillospiraceae bacterium]|nr:hypothetical protein [Oscillospiraceae bacterium]